MTMQEVLKQGECEDFVTKKPPAQATGGLTSEDFIYANDNPLSVTLTLTLALSPMSPASNA